MKTVLYSDVLNRAAEAAGRTRDKIPISEAVMMQGFLAVSLQGIWNRALWPELIPDPLSVAPAANRQFSKNDGNGLAGVYINLSGSCVTADGVTATYTATTNHGIAVGAVLVNVVLSGSDVPAFNGTFTITITGGNTFTYEIVQGVILPIPPFGSSAPVAAVIPPELGDILGVFTADPTQTTRYRDIDFEEKDGAVRIEEGLALVFVEFVLVRPDLMTLSGAALTSYGLPARFSNYLAMTCAGLLLKSDGLEAAAATCAGLAEATLRDELNRLKPADRRQAPRQRTAVARAAQ